MFRPEGEPLALQGYLLDVTEKREAEERLRYQAYHDHLTGLPNRRALQGARRAGAVEGHAGAPGVAVLILDIDDFKAVNDRFGHVDADAVLQDVGSRLRVALPPTMTVARIGGDEFAALVESEEPARDADAAARSVSDGPPHADPARRGRGVRHREHRRRGGRRRRRPAHAQADLAMYRAKANGKAQSVVYEPALDDALGGASRSWAASVAPGSTASSCSTTSPSSTSTPGGSWAPRRCCAGSTPRAASSRPASSSRSPRNAA